MITDALDFIHARKWLFELILLAVVVVGVWLGCRHLVGVGVQRQRDADAREVVKLQRDADLETARLQGAVDAAEKARAKEHSDLDLYRRQHPLHGGLCINEGRGNLSEAAGLVGGNGTTSAAAGDILEVPAGDIRAGGPPDPDVRHLFDVLAGRADMVSEDARARAAVP